MRIPDELLILAEKARYCEPTDTYTWNRVALQVLAATLPAHEQMVRLKLVAHGWENTAQADKDQAEIERLRGAIERVQQLAAELDKECPWAADSPNIAQRIREALAGDGQGPPNDSAGASDYGGQ
jgi:hypothetical protein